MKTSYIKPGCCCQSQHSRRKKNSEEEFSTGKMGDIKGKKIFWKHIRFQ